MTSGKGPGLPKEQRDWALEHLPQYMAKTGINKAVHGQPIPKDDDDLRTCLLELRRQFMVKFGVSNKAEIISGMTEAKIERVRRFLSFILHYLLTFYATAIRRFFPQCQSPSYQEMEYRCGTGCRVGLCIIINHDLFPFHPIIDISCIQ
jgi:hypothetical protein